MLFVCVSRRVFIVPRLNPEHPTRLRTCHHGKVSKHASRVIPVLFVEIFTCKRGAKYEGLSLEASRTFRIPCFTPQGRTSQLIPVTRKLQQPPLWQTAALHTSLTAVPWNHCELICLWSRLMRLRSFIRVLKTHLDTFQKCARCGLLCCRLTHPRVHVVDATHWALI